jgi:replicative DNA helicase
MLSDLRDSWSIEQDADLVVFLYRDEYYDPDTDRKGITDVLIAKNRNGETGGVELRFIWSKMKFEEL